MKLTVDGFALIDGGIESEARTALRSTLLSDGKPGTRCLLDDPLVRQIALILRERLCVIGVLPATARAIQAIAFDKTPDANWKVAWHQDVMFPFARPVTSAGYELPSKKDDVDYARPPRIVLEEMLAVRLHLDDCDAANGPLKVAPGSHVHGILRSSEISSCAGRHGEFICTAKEGEALLMQPLLLHASSPAIKPNRRRVLHLVYHSGAPMAETWYRSV
jgi:hypothetical protein